MNTNVMFSSASNEWATPQDVFDKLDAVHRFTLDPASTEKNAKCKKHYTKKDDGLSQNWGGGNRCFSILHMGENFHFGSRKLMKKLRRETQKSLC